MIANTSAPIGYLLKRYPRLSETFILNEMRGLERLGMRLHVFSLLRPEESVIQDAAADLRAPVTYFPAGWFTMASAIVKAHLNIVRTVPLRYVHALGLCVWWLVRSNRPLSVAKQFLRSAYVAVHCRDQGIRHLHAHFANAPTTVALFVSVLCDIPHSFTTHAKDLYLTRKSSIRARVAKAKFVLTCTRYNVDYLRSFIPPHDWHKLHLIYHGIDITAFPFAAPAADAQATTAVAAATRPLVLSVGRLVPKKRMMDVVSACGILVQRGVGFRCAIVGEGPLRRELEAQITALGLNAVVTLLGAMPHARLVALYGEATVFALAPQVTADGDRDGIPNVLAEAMAAGVPVVSSAMSGIPELIEDGRTGLLVEPEDAGALADAVERLLHDSLLRRTLSAAARRKIEASFECWEAAKAVERLLSPVRAS